MPIPSTAARIALCLPLGASLLWSIVHAAGLGLSDLDYTAARTELSYWGRANYSPDANTVEKTRERLESALRRWPDHPDYLAAQARWHVWQGYREGDPALALQSNLQALGIQLAALELRPADPGLWRGVARIKARAGQYDELWTLAREKSSAAGKPPP
jgi:hypothetical protein